MTTENNTPASDDSLASNLSAAESFFASKPDTTPAAPAVAVAATATPAVAAPAAPAVPSLIKTKPSVAATPAAAPVAAPVAITPEFDKLIGPDEKNKHRPDWDKMKAAASEHFTARSSAEAKLAAAEARLAARGPEQADDASKARIAQLETQVKGYDDKLKVFDLQSHPDFIKQYVAPQQKAVTSIKEALVLEGVTSANVDQILTLEGKSFVEAVSKLLPELSEFNRASVAQSFRDAKSIATAAKAALGNVDSLRTQYSQDFAARSRAAFDSVGKQFEDTLGQVTSDEKADDATKMADVEYNQSLTSLSKKAEALAFGQTSELGVSEMAHKSTRFDFMITHAVPRLVASYDKVVQAQNSQISDLTRQITELTGAAPRLSGSAGEGDKSPPKEFESNNLKAAEAYFTR
jgi:hypothetical protein